MSLQLFVRTVIRDRDGRFLVIKHSKKGSNPWNFPGGKVEMGESCKEAAIREAYEEIGVRIRELVPLTQLCITISGQRWEGHFFLVKKMKGKPRCAEPSKIASVSFKRR